MVPFDWPAAKLELPASLLGLGPPQVVQQNSVLLAPSIDSPPFVRIQRLLRLRLRRAIGAYQSSEVII